MLTLYDYLPSQNGWKVRVVLGLLGLPYRRCAVSLFEGEARNAAFLGLNPAGGIPVLVLEDGRALSESNAILAYLAEGTALFAGDRFARAKIVQWLCFEQYHVEPMIGSLRFWTLTGRLGERAAFVPAKREAGVWALGALERGLGGRAFLVGDALSIADIAIYAYGHLAEDCGFSFEGYPGVRGWMARVRAVVGDGYSVYPYSWDAHSGG